MIFPFNDEYYNGMFASKQWNGRFPRQRWNCRNTLLPDYWTFRGISVYIGAAIDRCYHCRYFMIRSSYWEPPEEVCTRKSTCHEHETVRHILRMLGINPYDYTANVEMGLIG